MLLQYYTAPQGGAKFTLLFWGLLFFAVQFISGRTVIQSKGVAHIRFCWLYFKSFYIFYITRISIRISQYRFEVTVDYLFPVQHLQAPEKSVGEAADESETEALEVVFFDELVQVHPNERKIKWVVLGFFHLTILLHFSFSIYSMYCTLFIT